MLCFGKSKSFIKSQFDLSARQVENYISRAREEMREALDKPREEHVQDALAVYRSIMECPMVEPRDRISAQRRIDKILGSEAAMRIHQTIDQKVTVSEALDDPEVQRLADELSRDRVKPTNGAEVE